MNKTGKPTTADGPSLLADEIMCTAIGIECEAERNRYVSETCQGNPELLLEVTDFLSVQDDAESLFKKASPTGITAAEIVNTLTDIPEFFEGRKAPLSDDDEVDKQIGHYKLLQKIGEGGVGNVYLAEQSKPVRRQVALKIIKAGMDTKSVIARFEAERQALAMMEHPNIAHVLNAGETETGRPYFVMELVHGERITTFCNKNALSINQRLELFIQVCHAIQHAHQKGIIHRDIKPSNVLVALRNGTPSPIVIDFGIAKATGEDLLTEKTINTSMGPIIGTPAYMSPEQTNLKQIAIDTRSDIYSLGALLYELLVGVPPFDHRELLNAGLEEMCRILRDQNPPSPADRFQEMSSAEREQTAQKYSTDPRRLSAILTNDLSWIVMKAMDKERDRRYESAGELAAEIQRFLDQEPVLARPPSRLYRFQKLVRRNKSTFAYLTTLALALLAGTGTSTWLFFRERDARNREAKLLIEADARTRIAQAYILISRGQLSEAELFIKETQIPVVQPSLEAAGVFRSLAEWNVAQGQWNNAAENYLKLQQANQLDKSNTTEEMTRDLLGAAPTLIVAGKLNEYRQFVQQSITRFSGTTDPSAAEQIIKNSLILPPEEGVLHQLQPYIQVVKEAIEKEESNPDQNGYYLGWRTLSISLYEYRCGHLDEAIYSGRRSLNEYEDQNPPRVAMDHLVIAMAYAKQGKQIEAREELSLGRNLTQTHFPSGTGRISAWGSAPNGVWHDWVIAHLLLKEAEHLTETADKSR